MQTLNYSSQLDTSKMPLIMLHCLALQENGNHLRYGEYFENICFHISTIFSVNFVHIVYLNGYTNLDYITNLDS